ncbi:hypothetical protein R1flu_005122 [Riccia fluitans]|uniref:Uncharacterized protein n=1 Tax=Riccia fluitans TaxID=41844 RepID=A0ABD1YSK0_9MARC
MKSTAAAAGGNDRYLILLTVESSNAKGHIIFKELFTDMEQLGGASGVEASNLSSVGFKTGRFNVTLNLGIIGTSLGWLFWGPSLRQWEVAGLGQESASWRSGRQMKQLQRYRSVSSIRINKRAGKSKLTVEALQGAGRPPRRLVDAIRAIPRLSRAYFKSPFRRALYGGISLLGGFYVAQTISLSFGALGVNDVIAAAICVLFAEPKRAATPYSSFIAVINIGWKLNWELCEDRC